MPYFTFKSCAFLFGSFAFLRNECYNKNIEMDGKSPRRKPRMKGKIVRKAVLYIIGMFILALGISFSVKSAFGVSPVTSVAFAMARLMSITLGVATIILYVIYVGAQYLLLRKKFPLKYLLQIPVSFIFGYFTDFTTFLSF